MRVDYLMKEGITIHDGYMKNKSGNSIFVTHNTTGKIMFMVNEHLRVYKIYKNKVLKAKTKLQIEEYFKTKGYKKI